MGRIDRSSKDPAPKLHDQAKSRNVSGVKATANNRSEANQDANHNEGSSRKQNAGDQFAISNNRQKKSHSADGVAHLTSKAIMKTVTSDRGSTPVQDSTLCYLMNKSIPRRADLDSYADTCNLGT
jgi:hypothetical protein